MTIEEFEKALTISVSSVRPRVEVGLDKVGELAATMAAAYIGHYQTGWAPLAQSTIADKAAKGFAVPAPLLRTGEMRDTIGHLVDPIEFKVVIGSTDPKALWQELGTSRIPPRSFLGLAMSNTMPFAEETFGRIAVTILMMGK